MLIPFDDPIWNRLYGVYGIRPPQQWLTALGERWDVDDARELYWEELHHQDTIGPVTYAALPWILETFPLDDLTTRVFLSHILAVAINTRYDDDDARYSGLSLDAADHHKTWLAEEQWLTDEDMAVLAQLQGWLDEHAADIADTTLVGIGDTDVTTAGYLVEGFLALHGKWNVARAVTMLDDEPEVILGELDIDTPEALAEFRHDIELVAPLHPELYETLKAVADHG